MQEISYSSTSKEVVALEVRLETERGWNWDVCRSSVIAQLFLSLVIIVVTGFSACTLPATNNKIKDKINPRKLKRKIDT